MHSALFLAAAAICAPSQLPPAAVDADGPSPPAAVVERRLRPVAARTDVVLRWNEVALQAIKADRTPPPLAARNLAMLHAAVYDAVNAIDRISTPYRVNAIPTGPTSMEAAAAVAAHRTLAELYPQQMGRFDRALDESLEAVADGPTSDCGVRLGQSVAEQVLDWRSADGSGLRGTHGEGQAPGAWRRTPPGFLPPLLPRWSRVLPFAIAGTDRFRPPAPPTLSSAAYAESLQEVKELGARHSTRRTAEQTLIAWFWSDDAGTVTPPGHWNRIAQVVARDRGIPTVESARLFCLLNLSLADAGICCWDSKYRFSFWRPITAIRAADHDGNVATESDPDWVSLLTTPPFPSYTSGHSTFSGAGAGTLASFFGTDGVRFSVTSEGATGVTRTFARFSDAASEAGRSRIYGGIHYEFDNRAGLDMGRAIAADVCRRFLRPRGDGTARTASRRR